MKLYAKNKINTIEVNRVKRGEIYRQQNRSGTVCPLTRYGYILANVNTEYISVGASSFYICCNKSKPE